MNYKTDIINRLSPYYQEDELINELFNSAGLSFQDVKDGIEEIEAQKFFDTLTIALAYYERVLGLVPPVGASLGDRKSAIQAKWLGSGKADIDLIQLVCNQWKNGEVEVFTEGKYLLVKDVHNVMTVDELQNTLISKFAGNGSFIGLKIILQFIGTVGIPDDLETLLSVVDDIKPAHLPLETRFKYLLVKDVHNVMTVDELQNTLISKFAGKK